MAGIKSSSVVMMCMLVLIILGLSASVNGKCDCCESDVAKTCCNTCSYIQSEFICKHTCCFPCTVSDGESSVEDYCKLGCKSTHCSNLAVVDGNQKQQNAIDLCHDACHNFCTKDASLRIANAFA